MNRQADRILQLPPASLLKLRRSRLPPKRLPWIGYTCSHRDDDRARMLSVGSGLFRIFHREYFLERTASASAANPV